MARQPRLAAQGDVLATVSDSKSSMRWNVRPSPSWARCCVAAGGDVDAAEEVTWPCVGRSRPVQALKVVVLPAPFGPMSPVIRPGGDVEGHVVDGGDTAEAHDEPDDVEGEGLLSHRWPPARVAPAAPRPG